MPCLTTTSGRQINYKSVLKGKRSESTRVILLHHGHCSTVDTWEMFTEELMKLFDSCYVVGIQAAGAGKSKEIPVNGLQDLVNDTLALVDTLFCAKQKFDFVGHSMGGVVGTMLAIDHPNRVSSIVLVAPAPSQGIRTKQRDMDRMRADRDFARQNESNLRVMASHWKYFKPRLNSDEPEVEEEHLKREIKSLRASISAHDDHFEGLWHAMERTRLDLSRLSTPTLMVAGSVDFLLHQNWKDFERLAKVATVHVFSRVGHSIPREVPAELAKVVADFYHHGLVRWRTLTVSAAKRTAMQKHIASLGQVTALYENPLAGTPSLRWLFRGPAAEKAAAKAAARRYADSPDKNAGKSASIARQSKRQYTNVTACSFYERPELGVASPPWTYRGPVAEQQAKAKYKASQPRAKL